MKELVIRTITGILLIVLFTGSLLLGPLAFLPVVILVYFQGLRELDRAFRINRPLLVAVHTLSGGMILLITLLGLQYHVSPLWFVVPALSWMVTYVTSDKLFSTLSLFWLAIPLSVFMALGWISGDGSYDPFLPLAVVALVWINDTFAYVTGKMIGRNQMAPILSPGKTWEGFFGGLAVTLVGGWIAFCLSGTFTVGAWLFIAGAIGLSGFLGDLFESKIKRALGMKNMGELLPGHGGILDRFDSLLFAAPLALLLFLILKFML